jgi:drug/metabolite transporter (DMT)-like permease
MIDRVSHWLYKLFEEYKIVRRTLVFWAIALVTWITFMVFTDITLITTAVAAAYATTVGVLGTVIGFYQWSRARDVENK